MADIGLNQNITIGSREFHVQTATQVDDGSIKAEIFEKGRILFVEEHHYERRTVSDIQNVDKRLRKLVDGFHHSIIEVIYSLFEISEKLMESDSAAAHEKLGMVFLYMHVFDKAEKHLLQAIDHDPQRYSSYIYLARCFYHQRRYNQAYELLVNLVKNQVHYPDMYNLMGLVLMANKNFAHSFNHFKEAIKINPRYTEAYLNLAEALLLRMGFMTDGNKANEINKNIEFLKLILKKVEKIGTVDDRKVVTQISQALQKAGPKKALSILHDYREKHYLRRIPPEVIGYEFYLRLCYSKEEMNSDVLKMYEEKIMSALEEHPTFPDLWNYAALVHLMQCRFYFLQGLDNFREATRINPQFEKARKNLRLVENDGREFLSLIKAIV